MFVYTAIDDSYKKFTTIWFLQRNVKAFQLSVSEISILNICDEQIGIDSKNLRYSFIKWNDIHLFLRTIQVEGAFGDTKQNL